MIEWIEKNPLKIMALVHISLINSHHTIKKHNYQMRIYGEIFMLTRATMTVVLP